MSSSLLIDLNAFVIAMALVIPRVLVCLQILPGFGLNVLTGIAKKCVAMAIGLPAVVPTYHFVQATPPDLLMGIALAFKEAAIGMMLGALMSIPFWVMQSIGSVLDMQRAAVQIQNTSPAVDRDASAIGGLLIQAVAVVMVQAGLFIAMARILLESYGPWPAYTLLPPFEPGHFDVVFKRIGDMFWHIVVYGGPVTIPLLLIEFAFALIGVFAPNLQVTFASAPVKSLAGLFILLVYWSTLSHYVTGDFSQLLQIIPGLLDASPR